MGKGLEFLLRDYEQEDQNSLGALGGVLILRDTLPAPTLKVCLGPTPTNLLTALIQ